MNHQCKLMLAKCFKIMPFGQQAKAFHSFQLSPAGRPAKLHGSLCLKTCKGVQNLKTFRVRLKVGVRNEQNGLYVSHAVA